MIVRTMVIGNNKYHQIKVQVTANNCIEIAISTANNYANVELSQKEINELMLLLTEAKKEANSWCE